MASAGTEALFFGFFVFRHLPKACFFYFRAFGGCRNVVFLIFKSSAGAESPFFSFLSFRYLPKGYFSEFLLFCRYRRLIFFSPLLIWIADEHGVRNVQKQTL